ncbi:MAG: hypothetical protein M3Z57_06560 [Candidatus Dormibacteraeota bacterium]|nr:hypothetical protein [Candidatus Dormibacteraeota bacterium]
MSLAIPAGLQAYAFYPAFLRAWNPPRHDPPAQPRLAPAALARYPALLAVLALAGAALLAAIGLTYVYVQQRRNRPREHRAQVGDHSGPYPAARHEMW